MKGASQCLGIQSLFRDFGLSYDIRIHTDSTAAQGISERVGLGKTRHIAVHLLWIQQHLRNHKFQLLKVKGTENPADVFTKHVTQEWGDDCAKMWGSAFVEGRSSAAPQVV